MGWQLDSGVGRARCQLQEAGAWVVEECLTRRPSRRPDCLSRALAWLKLQRDRDVWELRDSGGPMSMALGSSTFTLCDWKAMARLPEALHLTEGSHPRCMRELKQLARDFEPDIVRWIPPSMTEAAQYCACRGGGDGPTAAERVGQNGTISFHLVSAARGCRMTS